MNYLHIRFIFTFQDLFDHIKFHSNIFAFFDFLWFLFFNFLDLYFQWIYFVFVLLLDSWNIYLLFNFFLQTCTGSLRYFLLFLHWNLLFWGFNICHHWFSGSIFHFSCWFLFLIDLILHNSSRPIVGFWDNIFLGKWEVNIGASPSFIRFVIIPSLSTIQIKIPFQPLDKL